jgi:anaerobic magnesium-protoporphyrin IX monomethyl ester cyclase
LNKAAPAILFVSAPYHCGVVEVAGRWSPLHFCYLADAAAQAGIRPVLYDAMSKMATHDDIRRVLKERRPKYVGLSAITATLPDTLEVARCARAVLPEAVILLGGVHPSFMPEEAFELAPAVDFVIRGEGEVTLRDLLRALEAGSDPAAVPGLAFRRDGAVHRTPTRGHMALDETFRARHELLEWDDYKYFVLPEGRLGAVSTSRGCSHTCTFCSQQKFWAQTWRGRDPKPVAEEIESLYRDFGVRVLLLTDEFPTKERDRWAELLDRVTALRHDDLYLLMETRVDDILRDADLLPAYRKAGIVHIYVGVESGRQARLDLMKKELQADQGREALRLLREQGIVTETSFVLGFPDETPETVANTLQMAFWYDPDFAHFLMITPWPYADLWADLAPRVRERDYRRYNLIDPVVEPEAMALDALDEALITCYRDFYMKRFASLLGERDAFKAHYLKRSMQLIMSSSFIVEKFKRFPLLGAAMEGMMRLAGKPRP